MTTWNDLDRSIRATGAIDPTLVAALIEHRAYQEHRTWADAGLPRPMAVCFAEACTMVWTRARTILDNELALRTRAAMPAAEQFARSADLEAELADRALPPRPYDAREWREKAARLRRSRFHLIAAE
jgi:hypothetical protein